MSVTVSFGTLHADRLGGVDSVEVAGSSVGAVLEHLTARFPDIASLVWSAPSSVNPVMVLFLNATQLHDPILDVPVRDGDEITIVPAIEGGATPDAASGV